MTKFGLNYILFFLLAAISAPLWALEVNIAKDISYIDVAHGGELVRIQRIQDQNHTLTGGFAKTSRKCPPFCIQPMSPAPGVSTVGEIEIIDFMQTHLRNGTGVIIDARTPSWHEKGTIPGSVNIPFTIFKLPERDPRVSAALAKLGVTVNRQPSGFFTRLWMNIKNLLNIGKQTSGRWDFSNAKELILWCNGMWCGQSPRAIEGLLKLDYPVEKIRYYRGGMQSWRILGLTVAVPGAPGGAK